MLDLNDVQVLPGEIRAVVTDELAKVKDMLIAERSGPAHAPRLIVTASATSSYLQDATVVTASLYMITDVRQML